MTFIYVDTVDEVIEAALVPAKKKGKAAGAKPKTKSPKNKTTRKKTANAKNTNR
jgi:hypothetical protein